MRVTLQSGPGPFMADDPYKWTQLKSSGIANTGSRWNPRTVETGSLDPQTATTQPQNQSWPLFTWWPTISLFMSRRSRGHRYRFMMLEGGDSHPLPKYLSTKKEVKEILWNRYFLKLWKIDFVLWWLSNCRSRSAERFPVSLIANLCQPPIMGMGRHRLL